jgi:prepilin-type N-terminal cleavage/methylation domain-containing protein
MSTSLVEQKRRRGFSLVELLIVIAIILIIAAIAVPKLNRTRMQAQEMAAIRHVVAIHTSQTQYYSTYGKFATTLQELGPPASGAPSPSGADLIPAISPAAKKALQVRSTRRPQRLLGNGSSRRIQQHGHTHFLQRSDIGNSHRITGPSPPPRKVRKSNNQKLNPNSIMGVIQRSLVGRTISSPIGSPSVSTRTTRAEAPIQNREYGLGRQRKPASP